MVWGRYIVSLWVLANFLSWSRLDGTCGSLKEQLAREPLLWTPNPEGVMCQTNAPTPKPGVHASNLAEILLIIPYIQARGSHGNCT